MCMTAGTNTMRISVTSNSTATARPNPIIFATNTREKAKVPNTMIMMAAALVITEAVTLNPSIVARSFLCVRSKASFIRESKNTS